jgi:predicted nucleotidyltransferase
LPTFGFEMATRKDIVTFLKDNKPYYFHSLRLTKLGLMGSFSRDAANLESDIDLIVEFQPDTENLFDLKERLRKSVRRKFGREVDICRVKYLKPYFRKNILKDAIFI